MFFSDELISRNFHNFGLSYKICLELFWSDNFEILWLIIHIKIIEFLTVKKVRQLSMRASNYLPVNGDFFTKINEIVSGMNKIHQIHSLHFSRQEVKKFSFWLRAAFNAAVVKIYCTLSKFFCRCQKRGHTQIRLETFLEYDLLFWSK